MSSLLKRQILYCVEQGEARPCIIIQNNAGNKNSSITIVAQIISKIYSKYFLTNIKIAKEDSGLKIDSSILLNQIETIDKKRIAKKISLLSKEITGKVDMAIEISSQLE